jgi:hypothetical protein
VCTKPGLVNKATKTWRRFSPEALSAWTNARVDMLNLLASIRPKIEALGFQEMMMRRLFGSRKP